MVKTICYCILGVTGEMLKYEKHYFYYKGEWDKNVLDRSHKFVLKLKPNFPMNTGQSTNFRTLG